jgi:hypothetical protein
MIGCQQSVGNDKDVEDPAAIAIRYVRDTELFDEKALGRTKFTHP